MWGYFNHRNAPSAALGHTLTLKIMAINFTYWFVTQDGKNKEIAE